MDTSDTKARLTEQFTSAYGKPADSTPAPAPTPGESEHERRVSATYRRKVSSAPPAVSSGQAELDRQVAKTYGLKPPEAPAPAPAPQQKATEPPAAKLKAPEGLDANSPELESLKAVTKDLDPAHQEKLLAWHADQRAANEKALDAEVEGWRQAVEADPLIGGEHLASTISSAKQLIGEFGDRGLRELLDGPAGNHPAVVRFISKVSRALARARGDD